MDKAHVGGAFLSSFLQVLFNRLAFHEVVDVFKSRKLIPTILKRLEVAMTSVNRVLDDAEKKQNTDPAVKMWVTQLKDAFYDVDDLLDEIAYEALKFKLEAGYETIDEQVWNFFSFINQFQKEFHFEAKLQEILERVKLLVEQKDALGLKEGIGETHLSQRSPTTSLVDESGVCGMNADRFAIVEMVLQSEADYAVGNYDPIVIPIMGMGGIGKTTLAQLVYRDRRVQQSFDMQAWVCVSDENDPRMVTKHILEEVTSRNCDGRSLNQLQVELGNILLGKKFFVVLDDVDDVWNYYGFWDVLQQPLKFGARGSVILVTTRTNTVAAVMGTVPAYCLKGLDDDDSWFLFAKHAFANENSNARPDLEVVGREIVKKCVGLPLAIKTFGSLLRSESDVKEWKNILKSNLWDLPDNIIISTLMLSYYYLPSHLKQCFVYCALFPKDYRFRKEELILLWMAEGFIVPTKANEEMEEVGNKYFQDLVSRSFFSLNYDQSYIVHNFMHDLAELLSEQFYLRLENDSSWKISKQTRHLSSIRGWHITSKAFTEVRNAAMLRTFLLVDNRYKEFGCNAEMVNDLILALKQSRVLSLSNFSDIIVIPHSIGRMKHLRYLNLSKTNIKTLPGSVQNLYNLQILILYCCKYLIELPANMMKLFNLFHLDIGGTSLKKMPLQMGKLIKLRKLSHFIIGEDSGSRISELGELKHLRGELRIRNLQNVTNPQDALDANLKEKQHLKELELEWSRDTDDSVHERIVLEQLQPHSNMEHLTILNYGGTRFAGWVGDSSFTSMISLTIRGCNNCWSLPPLGQLPSLKSLKISEFKKVIIVGSEFYGSSKKPFPCLKSLRFEMMPQWEEWIPFAEYENDDEGGAFPVLQWLSIEQCPNLKKSLPSYLPCLTTLDIQNCPDQIVISLPRAPQLFSLTALKWPSLDYQMGQMVLFSASLEKIAIEKCNSIKCFQLELFPKLKSLSICGLKNLESLDEVENMHGNFTSPESLQITELKLWNCSSLKSLPERMQSLLPSLESLSIIRCREVEWFSEGGLPSKLKSLDIEGCKKLVAGYKQWNLQLLSSLCELRIGDINDVESFPEETLLPPTLKSLRISYFKNLKSLNYDGLQHLTNLTSLEISCCFELQCLSEEGLPFFLDRLEIYECPLLEQRCQRDEGEYWPMIAHIPTVIVNYDKVN